MKNIFLLTLFLLLCGCGSVKQQEEFHEKSDFFAEEASEAAPALERISRDVADEIEIGAKVKEIVREQAVRNQKHAEKERKKELKKQQKQAAEEAKTGEEQAPEVRQKDIFHGYNPVAILFGIIVVLIVALVSSLFWRVKKK